MLACFEEKGIKRSQGLFAENSSGGKREGTQVQTRFGEPWDPICEKSAQEKRTTL